MEEKIGVAYRASLCALRSGRNQLSIWNRLPDELLLMIFLLSNSEDVRVMFQYIHLTWVCRRWRTLALGHAEFWTNVDLNDVEAEVAEEFVARSKGAKLSVVMACRPHDTSQNVEEEHHRLLREVIGPQFGRVEYLDLDICPDGWEETIPILQLPAPVLRHFQLLFDPANGDAIDDPNFTLPADLFKATAQLRILRLYGVAPSRVSLGSMIHGLRQLKLMVSDSTPVLDTLEACPALELLHLTVDPVPSPLALESASAAPRSITMPRLSSVSLNDVCFLCHISTPLLKRLRLRVWDDAPAMLADQVARLFDLRALLMVVIGVGNDYPRRDHRDLPVSFQGWLDDAAVADVGEYDSEDPDGEDEDVALELTFHRVDLEALQNLWPALVARATNVTILGLYNFHTPEEVELVKHTVRHANKATHVSIGLEEDVRFLLPVFGDPSVCPELGSLTYKGIFDRAALGKELVSLVKARRNGPANIKKIQLVGCPWMVGGWAAELKGSDVDVQFLPEILSDC